MLPTPLAHRNAATVTISDSPAVVNLTVTDSEASEVARETGSFAFTRTGGDVTTALTVNYTIDGTATNGIDYTSIPGSITIPPNHLSPH
jgi:hypothetical protein